MSAFGGKADIGAALA